jgi:uncharacterized protein (DUF1697 family)
MALVTFLRGVNVGGHRTFRPSILAAQLKDYGVVNIGAAGTFVVLKPVSQGRLRSELRKLLPFKTEIIMCTGKELTEAASENPFAATPPRDDVVRFVNVLAKPPRSIPPLPASIAENGRWLLKVLCVRKQLIFGVYRREMKAIRCFGQMDKLFNASGTIRNWKTVSTILKVLEENELS